MDRELFEKAVAVRERAYAGYSDFPVGAALRTADGAVHAGCNVENASFPEGWCAETSAIAHMVAAAPPGTKPRIAAITVVARMIEGRLTTPCGGCRQRIAEFSRADALVCVADPSGAQSRTYRIADLLPDAFFLKDSA